MNWKIAQTTIWQPAGYRLKIEADLAQFLGRNNYFTFSQRDVGEFGDILAIDDINIYSGVCVPNCEPLTVCAKSANVNPACHTWLCKI